jgi:hypothetical protein
MKTERVEYVNSCELIKSMRSWDLLTESALTFGDDLSQIQLVPASVLTGLLFEMTSRLGVQDGEIDADISRLAKAATAKTLVNIAD